MKIPTSRAALRSVVTVASCVVLTSAAVGFGAEVPARAATSAPDGLYHAAKPKRLLDTRSKGGSVGVNGTVTIPRSAFTSSGMPSTGVQSVVVNVTVTGATGAGYAVAYPGGSTVPPISAVNFVKGWTGAAMATVGINGTGITVKIGGAKGTRTQVIVDLEGWYGNGGYSAGGGSGFSTQDSVRLYDSRTAGYGKLRGGNDTDGYWYRTVGMTWGDSGSWAGTRPTAALINLTATGSTGPGNLSAWNGSEADWPSTSSVNFGKAETSPNTVVVPLVVDTSGDYTFGIANLGRFPTDFVVDLLGVYYDGGSRPGTLKHVMVAPKRVMNFAPTGAGGTASVTVPSSMWDYDRTGAFEGTVTAVTPSRPSYLTAWDGSSPRPGISTLNVVPGQTRSNGTLVNWFEGNPVVSVYNNAGTTKAIVDITGRFDWTGPVSSAVASSPLVQRAPANSGVNRFAER